MAIRLLKEQILDYFILFPYKHYNEEDFCEIFDKKKAQIKCSLTTLIKERMVKYNPITNSHSYFHTLNHFPHWYVENLLKEYRRSVLLPKHKINKEYPKTVKQEKKQNSTEEKIISIQESKKKTMELLK